MHPFLCTLILPEGASAPDFAISVIPSGVVCVMQITAPLQRISKMEKIISDLQNRRCVWYAELERYGGFSRVCFWRRKIFVCLSFLPSTAQRLVLDEQNSKRETLIYIVHISALGLGCSWHCYLLQTKRIDIDKNTNRQRNRQTETQRVRHTQAIIQTEK